MNFPTLTFTESGWCEKLKTSYFIGLYTPKSREEYEALAPFAKKPVPALPEEDGGADKDALIARAVELKIDSPSTLKRWGEDKLKVAIAEAEEKASAATQEAESAKTREAAIAKAVELKIGVVADFDSLATEAILELVAKAKA